VRPLLQAVPPQQASLSPPHAPPLGPASVPGVVVDALQVPPEQTAPGLHAAEPQQGWPMAPHAPGVPPPGGIPPPPPGIDAEQAPPMHESPLLHAVPPQHVSPLLPHAPPPPPPPAGIPQRPLVQISPPLHAVPPQQASPLLPHAVIPVLAPHVPALHARPGLQAVPQHIWPSPPHAAGAGLHTPPPSQVSPALHELPLQQGWSRSPHAEGIWQVPVMHASVPVQVAPGQHD
jgi:hypothetical protein